MSDAYGEARPTGQTHQPSASELRDRVRRTRILALLLGAFALLIFGVSLSRLGADATSPASEERQ